MQKITSRGQWELYLAAIASAYDGKDSTPSLYSMNEANNFKYKVIIKNLTKGTEIQDYVTDLKLAPNRTSSKIQSSKATFSLTENIISHGDSIEIFVRNISETFEIKILSGKAKIENTVLNNYKMLNMNITIIDEVENLYSKIVPEDIFVFDNYLNNDNDKNNSIYHIIMRKLGFLDTELEIENIVNSNGSLVRIPFMIFKEGNRWIDELFTALDSIGARVFITPEGKVKIENGIDKRESKAVYDFTKNNILNSFETKVVHPDKNGSKVIYDNYKYLENQIIFGLAEKIEVKVGITPESNQKAMRIKYVSDIAKSYNLTKAEGYWYPGEDAASLERVQLVEGVHYKFEELKSSGAVIKFFNPFSKLFYIDVFEISGIPLVKYDGNEYIFKNNDINEKNDENFQSYQNNKYIQEEPLAAEVGKIIFLDKCKENTEYSFKCNFVPFLDTGDICTLDFLEKNELVRITSIEHSLGREKGCTSNIKAQKVIHLTEEEYKNSSLESLNINTSFLELKNLKEDIKNVEDEFKESEAWITGKIGAKAWISEQEPSGEIKDHDVWYKQSANEFKIWMNGKWNPATEEDIMPSLKSWIATQTAQLEMGKIIEQVGDDANSAYERAGIFLMNNDEKFGSMNGAIAEVSIDKNARILAKNVNNLLEFNTKDPTNPNVMTSKILMGVYDVNDAKHKDTAFQVGDEATGAYIKFDIAKGVQHVNGNGEDIEDLIKESNENAKILVDNLGESLQGQIDSKIDTWNQEADPAGAWTTDDLKVLHNGDLWYKPTEKATRRYRRTGTNTGTWDILDAKDTVAQSLAQSKKRVFTAQPTTPYEVGDLWITNLSATADLMVCKTALASGSYNSSHWVKGTKYTDDTTANSVQDNVSNGRLTINANTTFNGDASIVSEGTNETTEIKGGSITFTRNKAPITVIRNMRFGTATASSTGGEIVTLTGFDDSKTNMLPSLMEFNVSNTVRTLECRASRVGVNQWQFYLRGTENTIASAKPETTQGDTKTHSGVYSAMFHNAVVKTGSISSGQYYTYGSPSHGNPPSLPSSYSPKVKFSFMMLKNNITTTIQSTSLSENLDDFIVNVSKWFPFSDGNTSGDIKFYVTISHSMGREYSYTLSSSGSVNIYQGRYRDTSITTYSVSSITTEGFIDVLVDYQGHGKVQYIAFEE